MAFILPFWHAAAWIAALKLVIAACGLYLLARWTGLRRGPAALAAVAFAFSTYEVDQVQFPTSGVMAIVPWVMLMAGRVARGGRTWDVLGLIVAVGVLLSTGSPEFIAIGGGGTTAFVLYELLRRPRHAERASQSSVPRRPGLIVAGAVGGFMLAAAAILPFAAYLHVANTISRGGPPIYPNSIAYGFVFPELWGRPDLAISQFGPINYLERTAYFGAFSVLLALAGLAARRPRGTHAFWAGFTFVAGLIALNTPIHRFVSSLPGPSDVNLLRTLFLVLLGGSILAGFGLQRWLDGDRRERRRMLVVIIIAALAPAAFLLRHSAPFCSLRRCAGSAARAAVQLHGQGLHKGGCRLALAGARRGRHLHPVAAQSIGTRTVAVLAVGLVAADLAAINYGYNPSIPVAQANPATPPALAYLQRHAGHTRVTGILGPASASLQANMAERYGLADLGSYNFPKAERWAQLWGAYGQSTGDQNDWDPSLTLAHAALDAFAVHYVVAQHGVPQPAYLRRVFSNPSGDVSRKPDRAPASVGCVRMASRQEPGSRGLGDGAFTHRRTATPAGPRRRANSAAASAPAVVRPVSRG